MIFQGQFRFLFQISEIFFTKDSNFVELSKRVQNKARIDFILVSNLDDKWLKEILTVIDL